MSSYAIVTEATLDLPAQVVEELEIDVIPMVFRMDGVEYHHYPDEREQSCEEFYDKLKKGSMPTTAQVNPSNYEEAFRPHLERGEDVLCLVFSSGLSGSYQSALIAKADLEEEYPERRIICIDTLCASVGQGMIVYEAGVRRKQGMELDALADWVTANRQKIAHWFTVDDLFHLNRGGRLSAVEAILGSALKIKPLLTVDAEGKLAVSAKARGMKKAMAMILDKLKEDARDFAGGTLIIGNAANPEGAAQLREMILEAGYTGRIIIAKIGPIIGAHVGAGMLALVFLEKE